jgi:hypothetical protein
MQAWALQVKGMIMRGIQAPHRRGPLQAKQPERPSQTSCGAAGVALMYLIFQRIAKNERFPRKPLT